MNRPKLNDYDAWRLSPVGVWFFEYVQEQVDMLAEENGKRAGSFENYDYDHMRTVRAAGFVVGMEEVINHDPFADERKEQLDRENTSNR